jgi:hypothetical protein
MQTTLVNLRLEDDTVNILDKLAGKALNRQAVARMLLLAAIDAVERNQGSLSFPPQFTVAGDKTTPAISSYRLNEPHSAKRK